MPSFPPLKLGNVLVGSPAVQAALSGYSDWPMRMIAKAHGSSYALCEVLLDQFLLELKRRERTKHFMYLTDDERPVGGQLMGAEPSEFAAGAVKLAEAGFDVIDINFGCPVKKVLGRCRGGFHLSQPEVALDIVRRTRDAVPASIPVTLKMRRGIDESQESREKFYAILDGAIAAGAAAITVHGRTVQQRYIGPSRWAFLREVKQYVGDFTILGSGDLFSAEDGIRMLQETGVDGLSIARGAIGNPWIFQQFHALANDQPLPPPPSLHQQRDVLLRHWRLAEELYGADRAGIVMRKFGIKYAASHPRHLDVRTAFTRAGTFDQFNDVLDTFYFDDLPGQYPPSEVHQVQGEC
jgi:tRNA-dihydrouridine synthase B